MSKRAIVGLLALAFGALAGAILLGLERQGSTERSPATLAPPCQNHDSDVRVRVDTKHKDKTKNQKSVVPETFVACQGDTVTWEVHDPEVASFTVVFDPASNPFKGSGTLSGATAKSGPVKSPGLGSADKFKYFKYTLTLTFSDGTTSSPIDPGGIVMGP